MVTFQCGVIFVFSFLQEIDLGYASGVKALRTSYFGDRENGWKLLVPSEVGSCMEGSLLYTEDTSMKRTPPLFVQSSKNFLKDFYVSSLHL